MRNGGLDKLIEQACLYLADVLESMQDYVPGDSAIEKLFISALGTHCRLSTRDFDRVHWTRGQAVEECYEEFGTRFILVEAQAQLPFGRVDFLIHAYDQTAEKWRKLVVECDGHDFHERTKEQAAKDRSRDRQAQMDGYEVFRFTGSELWRDPWGCAEQVIAWAEKGLA